VLPGVVGLVQATETVKLLLGIGEPLVGRLLTYDALGMRFREVRLRRDPNCPLCGGKPSITDLSIHRAGADACAAVVAGAAR
jgi:bacteriocin biosynthesis cyclodehydratase domain-containing protein